MGSIPRDHDERVRFDAFCKAVLRNEARNHMRDLRRQRRRETFAGRCSAGGNGQAAGKGRAGTVKLESRGGALRVTARGQDNDTPVQPQPER